MHQLISKKVFIYLCLFFFLATVNNNSIIDLKLPKIESNFKLDLNKIDLSKQNKKADM